MDLSDLFSWNRLERFATPSRALSLSFLALILIGTFLLMTPGASHENSHVNFVDALFTATSAVCVTGLTVMDTGNDFTTFGQCVILTLFQLGGLGIMTFSVFVLYLFQGRLSLANRDIVDQTLSFGAETNLKVLLKVVFLTAFSLEAFGAVLLFARFVQDMEPGRAAYWAVFHSVSAFCNAGFGLSSQSLMAYRDDAFMNLTMAFLIISGGLGFVVLLEISRRVRGLKPHISLHSRVVLWMSGGLIVVGAVGFWLVEFPYTLVGEPLHAQIYAAFFQSVTARTAGFNTVEIGDLGNATLMLMMILMLIGASPGSCGGGIKTTSAAVVLASIWSQFRAREDVVLFQRRVPMETLARAVVITFFSMALITACTLVLLVTEAKVGASYPSDRGLFIRALFDSTSAYATVGLSTGLTTQLSAIGKLVLTLAMFVGRLGPLTIALAIESRKPQHYRYPAEKVLVG